MINFDKSTRTHYLDTLNYTPPIFFEYAVLPNIVSLSILKSPIKLHKGYLNVAGLFFSKKKCPTQANPYPIKNIIRKFPNVK